LNSFTLTKNVDFQGVFNQTLSKATADE